MPSNATAEHLANLPKFRDDAIAEAELCARMCRPPPVFNDWRDNFVMQPWEATLVRSGFTEAQTRYGRQCMFRSLPDNVCGKAPCGVCNTRRKDGSQVAAGR